MTDQESSSCASGTEYGKSAASPCAECPWRVENIGRPVPAKYGDAYTREQRVTVWTQLRNGVLQDCHMGAGDGEEFPHGKDPALIHSGFAAIPEHATSRECAGSLVAARREVERVIEAGSWAEYHARHPNGFTADTAVFWLRRFSGDVVQGAPQVRGDLTRDVAVIDPGHDDDLLSFELMGSSEFGALAGSVLTAWDALQGEGS